MKILIQGGRVIDPASRFDAIADVAVAAGRILSIGPAPADFTPRALWTSRCACASRATSTKACWRASWRRPWPVV